MKYGLNAIMKRENDEIVAQEAAVVGGVEPEVAADAQDAIQEVVEIQELAQNVEDYGEQLENLQDLQANHEVQLQVMDGDLSINGGKIENDGAEIEINIDAKELGEAVGTDAGEVLQPEASEEQIEEVTEKLENDLNSALACIGGVLRSGRFAQSTLGQSFENDMKRLKGKAKYRRCVEGVGDVAKRVWEQIKSFFKMIWEKLKSFGNTVMNLFRTTKADLENLKKKVEEREDASFEDGDESKASDALKAVTKYKNKIDTGKILDIIKDGQANLDEMKRIAKEATDVTSFNNMMGQHKNAGAGFITESLDGGTFFGAGIASGGVLGILEKGDSAKVHVMKVDKGDIPSGGDARKKMLLEIADQGIDVTDKLASDLYKEGSKLLKNAEGDVESIIKDVDEKVASAIKPSITKILNRNVQLMMGLSKVPAGYASALKSGLAIFHAKKESK